MPKYELSVHLFERGTFTLEAESEAAAIHHAKNVMTGDEIVEEIGVDWEVEGATLIEEQPVNDEQKEQQLEELRQRLARLEEFRGLGVGSRLYSFRNLPLLNTEYVESRVGSPEVAQVVVSALEAAGAEFEAQRLQLQIQIDKLEKVPLTDEEYLEQGVCPWCRSDHIEPGVDLDYEDSDRARQVIECKDCGKTWHDLMQVTGYEEIK